MCILQCSCFPAILLITQYCIAGSRMTLWMMLMIIIINDADDDHHHYDADDDASCCSILHWSALQGPGATGRRGRCCMLPLRNKPPRCNTSSSPSSDHHHNVAWMPGCMKYGCNTSSSPCSDHHHNDDHDNQLRREQSMREDEFSVVFPQRQGSKSFDENFLPNWRYFFEINKATKMSNFCRQ